MPRIDAIRYPETFTPQGEQIDLRPYPVIAASWENTQRRLTSLTNALTAALAALPQADDYCVAAAGSFGRMEASETSDLDYMVLAAESLGTELQQKILETIRQVATDNKISLPNPEGVFAQVTDYNDLIAKAGSKEDTLDSLAQRLLLLMEARPIYNETVFRNAVDLILRKYLSYLYVDPGKEALFLLNDLIRYFRSICVNYEFNLWREEEKWVLRNIKLRHSRIVMYAGLLLSVMNASIHKNKPSYIRDMLPLTPLERIVSVYQEVGGRGYTRILAIYDTFLRRIQDPEIRGHLQVDYEERHSLPDYREMSVTADALTAELTRFILSQRARWTEAVFEYVLF